jgi:hypothetical protein
VNCELNNNPHVIAVQHRQQIYYKVVRVIRKGTEVLLDYGKDYVEIIKAEVKDALKVKAAALKASKDKATVPPKKVVMDKAMPKKVVKKEVTMPKKVVKTPKKVVTLGLKKKIHTRIFDGIGLRTNVTVFDLTDI